MADRSEYVVNIAGLPHTFQLTEQEARRAKATPKQAPAPRNKARKPENKEE